MVMQDLAGRLIARETRRGAAATEFDAAFRVCEKLRRPLSDYAGAGGFRSLLRRALGLAKAEEPWLGAWEVRPDGSIGISPTGSTIEPVEAARGSTLLVAKLLELLVTFIGETLTLRLVHDVWPKVAAKGSKSRGKK
jgi:hypothetical protein